MPPARLLAAFLLIVAACASDVAQDEVGVAAGALSDVEASDLPEAAPLSSSELDDVRTANAAATPGERLRARQALADEITRERVAGLGLRASAVAAADTNRIEDALRSVRNSIVEGGAVPGDDETIMRELAAGARDWRPTPGDLALDAVTEGGR